MKSLQFEVWQECSQQCSFCYIGKNNRETTEERKLQSLRQIREKLEEPGLFEKYDNISLIGGEFFQGQIRSERVREEFFDIVEKIAGFMREGKIRSSWISATLTREPSEDLIRCVEAFRGIPVENPSDGLWLITSYDAMGRFHVPEQEIQWRKNLKELKKRFPYVKFNTTVILTGRMADEILAGNFDFRKFSSEMGTSLFFKQPSPGEYGHGDIRAGVEEFGKILPGFFPKRRQYIDMMKKILAEWPEFYEKLFNVEFRADDLYRNFNEDKSMHLVERHKGELVEVYGKETNRCGHIMEYSSYEDSDRCMLCDKKMVQRMFC